MLTKDWYFDDKLGAWFEKLSRRDSEAGIGLGSLDLCAHWLISWVQPWFGMIWSNTASMHKHYSVLFQAHMMVGWFR